MPNSFKYMKKIAENFFCLQMRKGGYGEYQLKSIWGNLRAIL